MSQERLLILKMISEGKLSPDEGERLLAALDGKGGRANGKGSGMDAAYALFSRTARDVQKGLKDISAKASEIIRDRQKDLREHIENITKDVNTNCGAKADAKRDHTITIEVEEETTTARKPDAEERASHDDQ